MRSSCLSVVKKSFLFQVMTKYKDKLEGTDKKEEDEKKAEE